MAVLCPESSSTGWYYEWCPVRDEIFALSDLIVIRAWSCGNIACNTIWKTHGYYSYSKPWGAIR